MATKKNNYIDMDLNWLEGKAEEMKSYCDSNPFNAVQDRLAYRVVKGGGSMPVVIASVEQIHKNLRDTLKDYAILIEAISKLREIDAQKKMLTRGDQELSPLEDGTI
jgi:hypothetical protein